MSNFEAEIKPTDERAFSKQNRLVKGLAMVALVPSLVSCAADQDIAELPNRNAPPTAEYSLDTNPIYRDDVAKMLEFADSEELKNNIENLQTIPVAEWLFEDSTITNDALVSALEKAEATATIPQFVLYNIPGRDSGNYSAGGAETTSDYIEWVESVSETIAEKPAVVVVEPDALSLTEEMDEATKSERISTLAATLDVLSANKNTAVYLDAGNGNWLTPEATAQLMREVDDVSKTGIPGISLNVSNYISEDETREYAAAIEKEFGQHVYVLIDNSRNGNHEEVEDDEWCNPEGQKLGKTDALFEAEQAVETAYIKTPGQSDGECGISEKPAGEFDGELLFDQLR